MTLSPVWNLWSFKVITDVVVLTLDEPKDFEFIIVLFVRSSYSTLNEVDMPESKISRLNRFVVDYDFLQITVPTTFQQNQ